AAYQGGAGNTSLVETARGSIFIRGPGRQQSSLQVASLVLIATSGPASPSLSHISNRSTGFFFLEMCNYIYKELSCQHHYHLVESWCPKYTESQQRCAPKIVSKQYCCVPRETATKPASLGEDDPKTCYT
ncbi:unnamed protein product, partial [Clonostachys chloroleuca]